MADGNSKQYHVPALWVIHNKLLQVKVGCTINRFQSVTTTSVEINPVCIQSSFKRTSGPLTVVR